MVDVRMRAAIRHIDYSFTRKFSEIKKTGGAEASPVPFAYTSGQLGPMSKKEKAPAGIESPQAQS